MVIDMEHIILASESARRREFMTLLGLPFSCMPPDIDETFDPAMEPALVAEELAVRKVRKVLETLKNEPPLWICWADTLIEMDGKIYGKPGDRGEAALMLGAFQGREHQVWSAIALYNGRNKTIDSRSVASTVSFAPLSAGEIEWYLDSGEWKGAAGSYKIQGLASCFINGIKGSYSSIVGLPLREIYVILRDNGYPFGG